MNKYPLWKYLMLVAVISLAALYALPNLYAPDPAIQVSGASGVADISQRELDAAAEALTSAGINYFGESISEDGKSALFRLTSSDDQLAAKDAIQTVLRQDSYVVALNRAQTTPDWLRSIGAKPMNLGLDLSGGVHFLLEVDTDAALHTQIESVGGDVRTLLKENDIRYIRPRIEDNAMIFALRAEEDRAEAINLIRASNPDLLVESIDLGVTADVSVRFTEFATEEIRQSAILQNLTSLKNRVDEIGVSEPLVQRQGVNRIVVELPGVQDTAEAKRFIGKTANLEFRMEHETRSDELWETFEFYSPDAGIGTANLESKIIVTGEAVTDAAQGYDQNGQPQVSITLSSEGGTKMNHATRNDIGRRMGSVFIESKTRVLDYDADRNGQLDDVEQYLERKIISLATVRDALANNFVITGVGNQAEAAELARLLKAGALAAPMDFEEERTVGPSLGAENIAAGITSIQIGLALVVAFMLVYYRLFGIFANISLAANLVLLTAAMSIIGATLTLPGIAGIVLTLGMAVDANVLIFSRIREELKNGVSPQSAIKAGYERAWSTILDANVTTLIVAAILWFIGTGPVKGFAVTLFIGILTSMFTAVVGSRAMVNLVIGSRYNVQKLWI